MEHLAMTLALIAVLGIGMLIGVFIGIGRMKKAIEESSVGDLRIDRSEPDEPPRPCLEVYQGNTIDSIARKKFVMLKVVNKNYLSRD